MSLEFLSLSCALVWKELVVCACAVLPLPDGFYCTELLRRLSIKALHFFNTCSMAAIFGKILIGIYVEIKRSDGKSRPGLIPRAE